MMYSKQSQEMLSSCGLRAGSRSLNSGGCSQCHLLSAEWQHRANLKHSMPEEYRCQQSQNRTWSWYEQKVFDQSKVEPQAPWKSRTRNKELRCCCPENGTQSSMRPPGEGALWLTRSVDGTLCCAHCLLIDFTLWQREKNLWQLVYLSQQKPESSLSSGGLPHLLSGIASDPVAIHYHLSKDNFSKTLRVTYHQYLRIKDLLVDTKCSSIIISSDSLMRQLHRSSLSVLGMQWWTKTREISALMGHMHQHEGAGYHPPKE